MQRVERKIEYLFDRLLHSYHNETPENKIETNKKERQKKC